MTKIQCAVVGVELTPALVVAASKDDCRWRAWNRAGGALVYEVDTGKALHTLAVEGKTLAVGGEAGYLAVFDLQTGDLRHILDGHTDSVCSVAIHDDTVVSGSKDSTVRVWSKSSGECLGLLEGHTGFVRGVALDGEIIVSGSQDRTVRVWDAASGDCVKVLRGNIGNVMCVALDEREIMTGSSDKSIKVWSRNPSFECVKTMLTTLAGGFSKVAVNPDKIVSGNSTGKIHVWSRASGNCIRRLRGHPRCINCIALLGDIIVSGSNDSTVRLWSLSSGAELMVLNGTEARVDTPSLDLGHEKPHQSFCTSGIKVDHWEVQSTYLCTARLHLQATDATEDNDVSADATPSWQDELDVLRSWSGAIPRDPVEEMKKSDWHEAFRSDHARLQKLEELLQQLQDRVRESPKNVDLQAQRNDCKKDLLAKLREVLRGPSVRACEREKSTCNTWLAKFGDGLDDDGKAVPFTEVQQSIQRGEDAFQQWQTRETPATTAARSKQARDELDAKVRKSLGRGGDDGLSFVDPKLLADVEEELNSLHRALQEEIDFAASFDPDEGTPGPCIATATRLARSFVRRSWADALRELNDNLDWMREKLSRFSSCEASPDASSCRVLVDEMLDVEDSISDAERDASRLQRRKLRTDVDVAAINTEITEMEALLKNLRTRRGRLSRQLCTTRARALRAAETHYPELLHDDTWLGQLGVHGAMVELLPELQSGLVLEHVTAADFEVVANGKSFACGNGKFVQQVRDKDGHDFVLKRFALSSEQASRHFLRQARLVHEIDSPNVISFHGAFVDSTSAYLLMPWFSKGDLAEWISEHQDGSTKSVETCKQIARGICAGLRAIHAQGHVHCDVKPSNVFLTPNLHAVIGDFDGLREIEQSMTRGMHVTFMFLPPEVRDGSVEKVDASIDMFALGVIMEQLFAGLDCDATALIDRLKAIDPQDRPSSTQVLEDPFLAAPEVVLHECLVCCAHRVATQVVTCAADHTLCEDCFRECVGSFVRGDTESQLQVAENGAVKCLCPTCPEMIPAQEAAFHADAGTWQAVMSGVKGHVEQELSAEYQRRLDEALESRLEDLQVEQHRNTVIESILNLQCPRCGTVFLEFNGCCALSCSSPACRCKFCAWCLRDCGDNSDDCHRHVSNCPENTHKHIDPFFGDMAKVLEAMQRRRADKLKAYWAEKLANQSSAVQQGVVAAAIGPLLEGLVTQGFELPPVA